MNFHIALKRLINALTENVYERRKVILALSCVVVFVTTYMLILPALTLEKDKAAEQGGIEEYGDLVVAVGGTDSGLSESMSVEVSEIDKNDKDQKEEYDSLYSDALKAVQETDGLEQTAEFAFAKFYDISLMDGKDEAEPDGSVDVTISFGKDLQKELKAADPDRVRIVHFVVDKETGETTPEVLDSETTDITVEKNKLTEAAFTADSFSVFAVVYTVDFHYEADGETYEFSIPGGGTISLCDLIKALGIEKDHPDTEKDEILEMVDSVENIGFSNPELLSVSKVDEDTTVGAIKERLGLECEYSADLTEEQIAEADAQTVKAGDWVLIALKPFDTEETLTVIMKNGDQFVVAVTDVQGSIISNNTTLENGEYMIVYKVGNKYYAYSNYGFTDEVQYNPSTGKVTYDGLREFVWVVSDEGGDWADHYTFKAKARSEYYIALMNNSILRQYWGWVNVQKGSGNNTFILQGETSGKGQYLGWNGSMFTAVNYKPAEVFLVKVEEAPTQFTIKVTVDDASHGTVSGTTDSGQATGQVGEFTVTTENVADGIGKYNASRRAITATPKEGYLFDHWEINGQRFDGDTDSVLNGTFSFSSDGTELKAVFKKDSTVTDEMTKDEIESQLKTWASDMLSDTVTTSKTAQVTNYEDRIYEITMSASSGVRRVVPTLDLAFITDVSRSMYFPATLSPVTTFTQGTDNDKSSVWSNDTSLYDWLYKNADKNQIYYVVSSDSAATVTALYYGGKAKNNGDTDYAQEWRRIDASYLNPPDASKLTSDSDKKAMQGTAVSQTGSNCVYYWNNLTGTVYTAVGTLKRMDYLKMAAKAASEVLYGVDPTAQVGLVTFAADAYDAAFYPNPGSGDNAFYTALTTADLKGGTDQADGLDKGRDLFKSSGRSGEPAPKRVAILITDGAPNQSGRTDWNTTISTAATGLKNSKGTDSVELYTLGLSMDMVGETNREGLKKVATGGVNGGHWFEANDGAAIVEAIKAIIGSVVNEASLKGTITDTIDEAFYPVEPDGSPLKAGDYIDLEGNKLDKNKLPKDGKYGKITFDGTNYGVEWSDQLVAYDPNNSPTWTGKVSVKAKEDFLGGNTIKTNVGENDAFTPSKYVIDNQEYNLNSGDDEKLKRTFETPHVNVDELSMTQHNTEWTVYLGTEVDPMEQITALLDEIRIREVVSAAKDHMIESRDVMLHSSETDKSETFPLSQAVGADKLSPEEWQKLLTDGALTMDYSAYGHDNAGKIVLTLAKAGDSADVNKHKTTETGEAVEQYIITAVYIPAAADDQADYHTTPGGAPGAPADTINSTNTHKINVYAKKLSILKVDQSRDPIKSSPAEFSLYRKAANGETPLAAEDVPDSLPPGDYVCVETLTTDAEGSVTSGDIGILPDDEPYYLVETKSPAGYLALAGAMEVNVLTQDTWTKVLDKTAPKTSDTKWNPYVLSDWVQDSALTVTGDGELSGYAVRDGNITYDHNESTETVGYSIINDAGASLPSTGGTGTTLFYLFGVLLAVTAGAGLAIMKRRTAE